MKKVGILVLGLLLLLLACAPKAAPPAAAPPPQPIAPKPVEAAAPVPVKPVWEQEWEKTLMAARKEGSVVLYCAGGPEVSRAVREAFTRKFGISLEVITAKGADLGAKVSVERRAGLYIPDVYMGGSTTIINTLRPLGALEEIAPLLVLPEVTDPNVWWQKRLPLTVDKERKYIVRFSASDSGPPVIINERYVKAGDLGSYYDFLQPRWKGKVIIMNLTVAGRGAKWFGVILTTKALPLDYFRELAKQEPVMLRDYRLAMDWIAHGKGLAGIALTVEAIEEYKRAGVPILGVELKEDVLRLESPGAGNLVLMKNAPHPNAAKVFINWFLSKEGQYVWSKSAAFQSSREDVPTDHLEPWKLRNPKLKYFDAEDEDFLLKQPEHIKTATEIFGHLLR